MANGAAIVLLSILCFGLCDCTIVLEVYRAIQYDIYGEQFGSRTASLYHYAGSALSVRDLSSTGLILPLREVTDSFIRGYIEHGKPLGGLLLLLPEAFRNDAGGCAMTLCDYTDAKKELAYLEQKLIHSAIQYPVYFAFEREDITEVLADVRDAADHPARAITHRYKLILSSSTPKKLASPTIINIQGWLPGLKLDRDANPLPTIAIVASYDTFGAAPELSVGSDSNGSGVVALLEIARLFSVLYSNPDTRGRYNILFGLTSGGPYNYSGTHKWLGSLDQGLLGSIDYAVCLNSLTSGGNELWLHVSKHPKNAYVNQIFKGLSNVAEELGLKVGLKHTDIKFSNSRVAWEHEQFTRFRVTAATLSGLSVAPGLLENTGGISDKIKFVDEVVLVQNIKLVAESLARQIYGQDGENITIFADQTDLAVNPHYVDSWLHHISMTPRVAPYLSKNNAFITALKEELAVHVLEVSSQEEVIDGMFTFYDATVNTMEINKVKVTDELQWRHTPIPYTLLLIFVFCVAGYCVGRFYDAKGHSRGHSRVSDSHRPKEDQPKEDQPKDE